MNITFRPELHPRNRLGRFREVLGSLKPGDSVSLPNGVKVQKRGRGTFRVTALRTRGKSPAMTAHFFPVGKLAKEGSVDTQSAKGAANIAFATLDLHSAYGRPATSPKSPGVPGRLSPEAKAAQVQRVRDSLLMTKDLPGKGLDAKKTRRVLPPMSPGTGGGLDENSIIDITGKAETAVEVASDQFDAMAEDQNKVSDIGFDDVQETIREINRSLADGTEPDWYDAHDAIKQVYANAEDESWINGHVQKQGLLSNIARAETALMMAEDSYDQMIEDTSPQSPGTGTPPQNAQLAKASTGDVVRVDNRWWTKEKTGKWQSEDYKENLSAEDLTSKYGRLQTSKSGLSGDVRPPQSPGTGTWDNYTWEDVVGEMKATDVSTTDAATSFGVFNPEQYNGDWDGLIDDLRTNDVTPAEFMDGLVSGAPQSPGTKDDQATLDAKMKEWGVSTPEELAKAQSDWLKDARDVMGKGVKKSRNPQQSPMSPGTGFDPDEVLDVDDPRIKNYVKDLPLDADGETNGVRIDRLPVGAQFIDGNGKTFTHMGTGFVQGAAVVRDDESGSLYQQDSGSNIAPVIASGDRVEDPANGRTGTYRRSTMTGESSVAWDDTPDSAEFYYEGELVPLPKAPMSPGTEPDRVPNDEDGFPVNVVVPPADRMRARGIPEERIKEYLGDNFTPPSMTPSSPRLTEADVAQELARKQRKLARQKPGARDKDLEETAALLETLLEDVSEADPQD